MLGLFDWIQGFHTTTKGDSVQNFTINFYAPHFLGSTARTFAFPCLLQTRTRTNNTRQMANSHRFFVTDLDLAALEGKLIPYYYFQA